MSLLIVLSSAAAGGRVLNAYFLIRCFFSRDYLCCFIGKLMCRPFRFEGSSYALQGDSVVPGGMDRIVLADHDALRISFLWCYLLMCFVLNGFGGVLCLRVSLVALGR